MKVSLGQPWKARARCSMHWTTWEREMEAFSDLRIWVSMASRPKLKVVEGVHFWVLGGGALNQRFWVRGLEIAGCRVGTDLPQFNQMLDFGIA